MKRKLWAIVLVGVVLLILISLISGYNSLVDKDEEVDLTQSLVINRLNQRQALINQLLPTVTGLQEHAENIYNMITQARQSYSAASEANDIEGMIDADADQVQAINQLLVVIEDNPDITATNAFLTLMDNISGMESAISQARKDYNDSVSVYNRSVRKLPTVLYASLFGFDREKPYWRMNNGAEDIPQINFNND